MVCTFRHEWLFYESDALAVNLYIELINISIISMGNNYC